MHLKIADFLIPDKLLISFKTVTFQKKLEIYHKLLYSYYNNFKYISLLDVICTVMI